jgi:hypothetical protein
MTSPEPDTHLLDEVYEHLQVSEASTDDEIHRVRLLTQFASRLRGLHSGPGTAVFVEGSSADVPEDDPHTLVFSSLKVSRDSYVCSLIEFRTHLSPEPPTETIFVVDAVAGASSEVPTGPLLKALSILEPDRLTRISRERYDRVKEGLAS